MPRARRRYTDEQRVTALAVLQSNDGNLSRTSRETGISITTIRNWRDNPNPDLAELGNQKKAALSELWEDVARAYIQRALEATVITGSGGQTAITVAAIATDKMQLLTGNPTENIRHEHNERATPQRALEAAAAELRRRGLVN